MRIKEFAKDDYFKIDSEAHLYGDTRHLRYFKWHQQADGAVQGINRFIGFDDPEIKRIMPPPQGLFSSPPEILIEMMDKYGIEMACVIREDISFASGFAAPYSTNGQLLEACEKYPNRLIFVANVSPILRRGMENALWELEYLVKEKECKVVKLIGEQCRFDDRQLWPFYEKIRELGLILFVHTGAAWLPPFPTKYYHPEGLDEVATNFPEIPIVAFHAGWPHTHTLNMIAATHPNIYIQLSLMLPWCITAPRRAAEIIGEAIQFAGPDRVVFGTDYFGPGAELVMRFSVQGLSEFEIPEDMQKGYNFAPLTKEVKRKIFGENLARLLGIEQKRKIKV
jgi:predicted TIM-barrel fold metal-dependent hydrolase